jgi:hypothetical protein
MWSRGVHGGVDGARVKRHVILTISRDQPEEEFTTVKLAKYGPSGARLWFWFETVKVVTARNPVYRWILITALMRLSKWIVGMGGD